MRYRILNCEIRKNLSCHYILSWVSSDVRMRKWMMYFINLLFNWYYKLEKQFSFSIFRSTGNINFITAYFLQSACRTIYRRFFSLQKTFVIIWLSQSTPPQLCLRHLGLPNNTKKSAQPCTLCTSQLCSICSIVCFLIFHCLISSSFMQSLFTLVALRTGKRQRANLFPPSSPLNLSFYSDCLSSPRESWSLAHFFHSIRRPARFSCVFFTFVMIIAPIFKEE